MTKISLTDNATSTQPFIYTYSHSQAVANGILIDVTDATKPAFKFPVFITDTAWQKYVEWTEDDTKATQNTEGRLNYILVKLLFAIIEQPNDTNSLLFKFHAIPRNGKNKTPLLSELKCESSSDNNGKPILIIMLPEENQLLTRKEISLFSFISL